jgi:predicted TIM-barrel fold metal-dependent hydrolase
MEIIDVSTLFGFWPRRQVDISLDCLLKLMDKHEISQALTVSTRGIFIDTERGNSETIQAFKDHSQRFVPVATIDPRCGGDINNLINRCVEEGFQHIRFFPDIQKWDFSNLVWQDIYEMLINCGKLCLHLPAAIGLAAIDKLSEKYPLPVIVHGSRFIDEAELGVLFRRRKNVFAEISYLIGVGSLERLSDKGVGDRLLLGTNSPLNYTASAMGIVRAVSGKSLRDKIMGDNAAKLMESLR